MSWLNNFLSDDESGNSNGKLSDKELALDMLKNSKNDITILSRAVSETMNPQLRQMLTNQLNACINDHFKLSDMAVQKGWYNAYSNPGQQIRQDMQEAQNLLSNNQ